jgi:serine/threonine protein kinase
MKSIQFKGSKYIKNEKVLSRGGYGVVYSYHNNDTEQKLVMKQFLDTDEYKHEEVKSQILYGKIMDGKIKNVISSYYNKDHSVIIMPMKDGDLSDTNTISKLSVDMMNQIYKQVVLTMINMLEHDLFYCDLKPGNVLFSKQNENTPRIYLADIGGIVFDPTKYETPNYPDYVQDIVFTYPYKIEFSDEIDTSESIYVNHDFLSSYIQQIVSFYFIFVLNMDSKKFVWSTPFGKKYAIQQTKVDELLYKILDCYNDHEENHPECKQILLDFLEKIRNIHENIDEWKSEFMVDNERRSGRHRRSSNRKPNKNNKPKNNKKTRKRKNSLKTKRQNEYWLWCNKDKLRKKKLKKKRLDNRNFKRKPRSRNHSKSSKQ